MSSKQFRLTAVALALIGAGAACAADFEFTGYSRAGVGVNTKGGKQVCYGLAGADTKWRLGNECDYVIEPSLVATVAKSDEYGVWKAHFMPSAYRAWGQSEFDNYDESGSGSYEGTDELVTRFGQVYFYGELPQLNGGRVWAGRRFYDRVQLGINDQFLENHDSDGAGIEDVNFGFAKFSYAFLSNPRAGSVPKDAASNSSANSIDYEHALRLTGIKTIANSELAIYTGFSSTATSENQLTGVEPDDKKSGQRLGLYHVTKGTLGGATFIGFKYDRHMGADRQWRVVAQQQGLVPSLKTAWDAIAEYRTKKNDGVEEKWYSIGGRTDTQISGPFRFLAELGHDQVKPEGGDTQNLTKFTLAVAASAGPNHTSRPTVRLFMTHARWNDAAKFSTVGVREVYGDKKSGTSFGIQGEAWW
ncbi:carbohydrate porin [Caldimonas brevitalea]|uniref:Maltoporin n=1 Tax=Caldimonas brevitalea TaxID=413882 RepID=A0A0G3BGC3_9BURK|nr:carbohydrate porin [Caldimonas brevitalea]AKJ28479.1 maltoporin [Caldimonas brevitalea]